MVHIVTEQTDKEHSAYRDNLSKSLSGGKAGSSTAMLVEAADTRDYAGELPSPRHGMVSVGVYIDSKVLMTRT